LCQITDLSAYTSVFITGWIISFLLLLIKVKTLPTSHNCQLTACKVAVVAVLGKWQKLLASLGTWSKVLTKVPQKDRNTSESK